MKQEDIQKMMEALGKANIHIAGDLVIEKHVEHEVANVEAGGIGIQVVNGMNKTEEAKTPLSKELLGKAIKQVQSMFWGQSSYAVIYCAVRDYYEYGDNITLFEEEMNSIAVNLHLDYPCPQHTIISSFHNNPYLRLHVSKWESHQVKPRSINLVKSFLSAIKEIQNK